MWLTIYAVAMAYVESAVVVYLRALYYPHGFDLPLVPMPPAMVAIETGREAREHATNGAALERPPRSARRGRGQGLPWTSPLTDRPTPASGDSRRRPHRPPSSRR
jgi:hypothetical protein